MGIVLRARRAIHLGFDLVLRKIAWSAKLIFKQTGLGITKSKTLEMLENFYLGQGATSVRDMEILNFFHPKFLKEIFDSFEVSKSELRQDIVALASNDFKRNGYFVEFGATDGVLGSNTYLLEKSFFWEGILVEPAKVFHETLVSNRKAKIDFRCVFSESNLQLLFRERRRGSLSTLDFYEKGWYKSHKLANSYFVETVSLQDLLEQLGAPHHIDFLSIDTEGSELDILQTFDFSKYSFGFISCEHNGSTNRELVYNLLTSHGYTRILEKVSAYDDWYIKSNYYQNL